MTMPEIMNTIEVAKLLRVTPQHIRALSNKGEIPHMRIGKDYRFVRSQLIERFPNLKVFMQQITNQEV